MTKKKAATGKALGSTGSAFVRVKSRRAIGESLDEGSSLIIGNVQQLDGSALGILPTQVVF
jgi:hypothetical protein